MPKRPSRRPGSKAHDLTDNEGSLLSLVARCQPVTAYQIVKIYDQSPVASFNASKGGVYPLINRLRDRGLLAARAVAGDARRTEQLACTAAGRRAIAAWVRGIGPRDLLVEDSFRTKIMSLHLLSHDERVEWVFRVKDELAKKLEDLQAYGEHVAVPYHGIVHGASVDSLHVKGRWLDLLLKQIISSETRQA